MTAAQFVPPTDAKNFPKALDKTGGPLCEGQYTLTKTGFHYLDTIHGGGTVYIDGDGNHESVGRNSGNAVGFYVTKAPSASLGTVSLALLAQVCSLLGATDANEANGWSDGADVNRDGRVDYEDVQLLLDQGGANIDVAADVYQGADVTQDERVDFRDYAVLASHWGQTDASRSNLWAHGSDYNRSGTVDGQDLAFFAACWLKPLDPNQPRL